MINQTLAMLRDGYRELTAKWVLPIMLALSLLPVAFCASITFERRTVDLVLTEQIQGLGRLEVRRRTSTTTVFRETDVSILETSVSDENEVTTRFTLDEEPGELGKWTVSTLRESNRWALPLSLQMGEIPDRIGNNSIDQWAIEYRLQRVGWTDVDVVQVETDGAPAADSKTFEVVTYAADADELEGAHRIWLLSWQLPSEISIASFVYILQVLIAQGLVGTFGILVAVSACAGMVPDMLQKGTLDLLLARPVARWHLLLTKYISAAGFVLVLGALTIGGSWFALWMGSGFNNPAFLALIPVLVVNFATVHSVSVLIGVLWRTPLLASLAAIGVWALSSAIADVRRLLSGSDGATAELSWIPEWANSMVETLYWILPKTADIANFGNALLARSSLSEAAIGRTVGRELVETPSLLAIGSSFAFAATMLSLAAWRFRARDW